MNIITTWHGDQFNVELASSEGAEPFLSVKGCRIVDGSKGPFVSYPATKNATTGKWWSHAWGSDKFNAVVLSTAQASMPQAPRKAPQKPSREKDDLSDVPF
jgi:hypothetical protein